MSKLHEVINSLSDESLTPEAKKLLLLEADATDKENKGLFVRAKKAQGFVFNKETKEWEKPEPSEPVKTPPAKPESNEPDYAKIAFLEARGLKHPDDQKLALEEAVRLKLPLTEVLGMEHIQSKLKNASDQRIAAEGMPQGGSPGSGQTRNDVDYWLSKPQKADGTYDSPDDLELFEKVKNARIAKEESGNKFADIRL